MLPDATKSRMYSEFLKFQVITNIIFANKKAIGKPLSPSNASIRLIRITFITYKPRSCMAARECLTIQLTCLISCQVLKLLK